MAATWFLLLCIIIVIQGNLVAIGTHNGYVQIWDVAVNKQVNKLVGHSARVGALAWNGDILTSGSRDKDIFFRDVRTPSLVPEKRLVGHRQEVYIVIWKLDQFNLVFLLLNFGCNFFLRFVVLSGPRINNTWRRAAMIIAYMSGTVIHCHPSKLTTNI